jgi:hypothetical protein
MYSKRRGEAHGRRFPRIMISTGLLAVTGSLVVPAVAGADGFTSKGAAQIFKSAVSASGAANSFSVRGSVDQPKMNLSLNLTLSASGAATGTLSINGGLVEIREIAGTGYFKGDTTFWTANSNATTAQLFAGKWIYAPITNSLFSGFRSFLSPKTFIHTFFGTTSGPFTKSSKTTKVDGKQTIGVMSNGPGTMYVATSGTHFIVKVQGSKTGSSAILTFGSYNNSVHPVKPAGGVSLKSLENA